MSRRSLAWLCVIVAAATTEDVFEMSCGAVCEHKEPHGLSMMQMKSDRLQAMDTMQMENLETGLVTAYGPTLNFFEQEGIDTEEEQQEEEEEKEQRDQDKIEEEQHDQEEDESWSSGSASWKAARAIEGGDHLWDLPNACDHKVLRSSAPLTVLFALSGIWKRVHKRTRPGKPLEIHVLGASYPFEGRSDWSLLAAHRPAEIPGIRVSLILGTPFQSDNVPPLSGQPNELLQTRAGINPAAGKWSNREGELICDGDGKWGTAEMDRNWSKGELCRNHGNGLEVVCIESMYQDVRAELHRPDLAVMFSPGFPQLVRRSWDEALIGLLNDQVPTVISDVVSLPSWGKELKVSEFGSESVLPGDRWDPSAGIGEDWLTWSCLKHYGAFKVTARRGPFPILHKENGAVLAKNGVVQIYEGFEPNKQPIQPVSPNYKKSWKEEFDKIDWQSISDPDCFLQELKSVFSMPTSRPFDNALREFYKGRLRREAHKRYDSFSTSQRSKLVEVGLLKGSEPHGKRRHWGLQEWIFILQTLGCRWMD